MKKSFFRFRPLDQRERMPSRTNGPFVWLQTLLLAVAITSVASAQAQKIRIGYPSFAPGFVVGWIGLESGIFKQHGLDPEVIYLRGGQQLVPALIGQSVDIALGSDTGIYSALIEGA